MKTKLLPACAAVLATLAPTLSHAVDFVPDAVSLRAGIGKYGTTMVGAGIVWDWDFERLRRSAELTAHTELIANQWRYTTHGGGHETLTQWVVLPTLRMQLKRGQSPWFVELGIGASWTDRLYDTPRRTFSTQWNFYDVLGVGRRFGPGDKYELGLRWAHTSNAGIRKPNPGQDFLQLRYVARF